MIEEYRKILKDYWGYDNFRGIQEDIIQSIGSGRDTLGLMPTGGGKSITFQVPAMAKDGLCIVITPLIALMKDQVRNLRDRGIKAIAIYSGMTREEIIIALENCIFGNYKFLYISPERLDTEIFRIKLRSMKVSMITVDESHCISQWGYDFRPAYLKISEIRNLLPDVPVLALTATATPEVVKDIQQRLAFKEENVFRMSFERKNLAYIVRRTESKQEELLHILKHVEGSAIVYAHNRKRTKEYAQLLNEKGITATFYHAGLSNDTKDQRQKSWVKGETRVMVATNAFGMGIDKPDVRLVVHVDTPDSPEAYFQEAGRGGRDGKKAYAVLLYSKSDKATLKKRIADTFPEKDYIRTVYEHLNYYYQMAMGDGLGCTREFNIDEFCRNFKHFPIQVDSALKILTRAGYLEYTDEQDNNSRLMFTLTKEELYRIHETSPETEKLINIILRSYTGVFTEYAYINEETLSLRSGMTRQQVYDTLISLTRRRILHYIPGKKTPYIIYTRERQEADRLVFTKEVYEDRKESFIHRIEAMTEYAETDDKCRSRMLLLYFGEKNEHNCGQCDVCLSSHSSGIRQGIFDEISRAIEEALKDKEMTTSELMEHISSYEKENVAKALSYLLSEEIIYQKNGRLSLPK
ncbi:ATP-dependent DNA helicase RecQ [uncultured Bacteroides sp.]|uniref:RecQ family ATP-dependent DNA helicase n=1 Tax=uncultured Bacteroides sp. TaxID=162156 RepID=UPI0025EC0FEA|nr:ATP-dependent DNA helicase RecQ [uncultured Bacteroides sp.]